MIYLEVLSHRRLNKQLTEYTACGTSCSSAREGAGQPRGRTLLRVGWARPSCGGPQARGPDLRVLKIVVCAKPPRGGTSAYAAASDGSHLIRHKGTNIVAAFRLIGLLDALALGARQFPILFGLGVRALRLATAVFAALRGQRVSFWLPLNFGCNEHTDKFEQSTSGKSYPIQRNWVETGHTLRPSL